MILFLFIQKIVKFFLRLITGESPNLERNSFLASVGLVILIVLLVFGFVMHECESCRSQKETKKIENINANIALATNEAVELTNQKTDIQEKVKQNEINANSAIADFNNSIRRDSNSYDGANAANRFCTRFADDPSCQP